MSVTAGQIRAMTDQQCREMLEMLVYLAVGNRTAQAALEHAYFFTVPGSEPAGE